MAREYFNEKYPEIVKEVDKGERGFFKILDDRNIVLGRRVQKKRWLIEGTYRQGRSHNGRSPATGDDMRFSEVIITDIVASEGTVPFDATVMSVDGKVNWHIVFILERQLDAAAKTIQRSFERDIHGAYVEQVVRHEMNHVLTGGHVGETGELRNFKSELLADVSLVSELNSQEDRELQLALKMVDVKTVLGNHRWTPEWEYYRLYLIIVSQLLSLRDPNELSSTVEQLQSILVPAWKGTTLGLYERLSGVIPRSVPAF